MADGRSRKAAATKKAAAVRARASRDTGGKRAAQRIDESRSKPYGPQVKMGIADPGAGKAVRPVLKAIAKAAPAATQAARPILKLGTSAAKQQVRPILKLGNAVAKAVKSTGPQPGKITRAPGRGSQRPVGSGGKAKPYDQSKDKNVKIRDRRQSKAERNAPDDGHFIVRPNRDLVFKPNSGPAYSMGKNARQPQIRAKKKK